MTSLGADLSNAGSHQTRANDGKIGNVASDGTSEIWVHSKNFAKNEKKLFGSILDREDRKWTHVYSRIGFVQILEHIY